MVKASSSIAPLKRIFTSTLLAFALVPASADTLTLKNGEEYEGTVEKETDTELVMTVQVSGGITDLMTFQKSEVRAVVKTPRDNIAFEELGKFKVKSSSQTPAFYNAAIAAFEAFVRKFPESAHCQAAKSEIETLKEEKARIAKKEIKWNNHWYTAAEAAANKYQIQADQLLSRARDLASRGDLVGALNTCDAIEKAYPGSRAYPESVRFALSLVPRLSAEIDRAVPIAKRQEQEFNEGIVLAVEPEKSRMIQARKDMLARAEAAVEQSQAKWKPFAPISEKSTTALKQTTTTELQRLKDVNLDSIDKSIAAADAASKELAARNAEAAEAHIKTAQTLWSANELLVRLNPALAALKKELAAAVEETASPAKAEGEAAAAPAPAQQAANPAQPKK